MNKFYVPLLIETAGGVLEKVGEAVISLRDSCLDIDRVTFIGTSTEQLGVHYELLMSMSEMALKATNINDLPVEKET